MSAVAVGSSDDREPVAIRATLMRGGTSKGLFFAAEDLPHGLMQRPGLRDALLLRVLGGPDPHDRHADGLGGLRAARSKVVIASRSLRADCDVECLCGTTSVDGAAIDWTGHCGNLCAAIGPYAIARGWVATADGASSRTGTTTVGIWLQSVGRRVVAHVPTRGGRVVEGGTFREDGVASGAAEIRLEFLDPADDGPRGLLPTGNPTDLLHVPELADFLPARGSERAGSVRVTLIDAAGPMVFVRADALRLTARELPDALQRDAKTLARLDAVRARAVVAMGLARTVDDAMRDRATSPKIAFLAAPVGYRSSGGADIEKHGIDVLARMLSGGRMHHAFTATGSIALAVAAALPGTVVSELARTLPGVPTRIGHPSGVLAVGAVLDRRADRWHVERALMSRSARRLMDGEVFAPR